MKKERKRKKDGRKRKKEGWSNRDHWNNWFLW